MKLFKVDEFEITQELKEQHLARLADAFFENIEYDGSAEFGSIGLDCKRPFGNSSVEYDIIEIIGLLEAYNSVGEEHQRAYKRYARELYCNDLVPYLKRRWADL